MQDGLRAPSLRGSGTGGRQRDVATLWEHTVNATGAQGEESSKRVFTVFKKGVIFRLTIDDFRLTSCDFRLKGRA